MAKPILTTMILTSFLLTGCTSYGQSSNSDKTKTTLEATKQDETSEDTSADNATDQTKTGEVQTVAAPEAIPVLVNKQNSLPDEYEPDDLVYPNIYFTFQEKIEKRMLRKEAAEAIEKLFTAASMEDKDLAGVSAYRSRETQTGLFNLYVEKDGLDNALLYSAVPGTSEHETGLAIDVTVKDGSCPAQDCFGETDESAWLAENASLYGFIIRYPKGKEDITGYKYEPWHLRYVGKELAHQLAVDEQALEEYYEKIVASK